MNNQHFRSATKASNDWKMKVTTVTPFSKYLALALFVLLPFFGFWLGLQYTPASSCPTDELIESEADTAVSTSTADTVITENQPSTPAPAQSPSKTVATPVTTTPAGPTTLTVYITEATLEYISVDNIAIYKDDAAVTQMIADGLCPAAEPQKCRLESGVYYRNTDPSIRSYALSPSVQVETWTGTEYPLSQLVNKPANKTPYTITINNYGIITHIKEIYRP